jgi:ribosomal protein S18 acetylase RimI-like enzyme
VSNVLVRNATHADLKAAAALGAEIVRVHHDTNPKRFFWFEQVEESYIWWLTRELERKEAVVLVAELDAEVVGFAYGAIEARDWSILVDRHGAFHDLAVAEQVRRRGIGRKLALEMISRLEELGAERILVRAMVQNESAQRLVRELGFEPTMVEMTRERG